MSWVKSNERAALFLLRADVTDVTTSRRRLTRSLRASVPRSPDACVGDAFGGGTAAANNSFFTPGSPALPFKQGCKGAGATLATWQANGGNYDAGSTVSEKVTIAMLLQWAKERLGLV